MPLYHSWKQSFDRSSLVRGDVSNLVDKTTLHESLSRTINPQRFSNCYARRRINFVTPVAGWIPSQDRNSKTRSCEAPTNTRLPSSVNQDLLEQNKFPKLASQSWFLGKSKQCKPTLLYIIQWTPRDWGKKVCEPTGRGSLEMFSSLPERHGGNVCFFFFWETQSNKQRNKPAYS